jgi:hypothetical protein
LKAFAVSMTWFSFRFVEDVTSLNRVVSLDSTSGPERSQIWPEIWAWGLEVLRLETAVATRSGLEDATATVTDSEAASWAMAKPIPEVPPMMRMLWPLMDGIFLGLKVRAVNSRE